MERVIRQPLAGSGRRHERSAHGSAAISTGDVSYRFFGHQRYLEASLDGLHIDRNVIGFTAGVLARQIA